MNLRALEVLKNISNFDEIRLHIKHFNNEKQLLAINNSFQEVKKKLILLDVQSNLPSHLKNKKVRSEINNSINTFLGKVLNTSPLYNLLLVNTDLKYQSKKVPREKEYKDFVDYRGGNAGKAQYLLHTKGLKVRTSVNLIDQSTKIIKNVDGGRTDFDSAEDCLSAMIACLDTLTLWKDVEKLPNNSNEIYGRIKIDNKNIYKLKIQFPGTDFWVNSDDSRLRHILCNGNPPIVTVTEYLRKLMKTSNPNFKILYPCYAEFLRLVEVQFKQIVINSHNNVNCPITLIHCCRIEPVCSGETYFIKSSSLVGTNYTVVVCKLCQMEVCALGCGRIHHIGPCISDLDHDTKILISQIARECPKCEINIEKNEGCNHMTCRCNFQFCWICMLEIPRTEHGTYDTALHYDRTVNGCNQFNGSL